ncbi:MAG: hypothetical protein LBD78_08560 [Spirochaetaceae bacterium]|jgi:hypothetical protein|nr:hypothetical protein [Spirochaetaceae bacterium]
MGDGIVEAYKPPRGTTPEEVWDVIRETERLIRELAEDTGRKMRETDRKMKETDRKMRETDRRIGKLGSRLGEVIEHIMTPKLYKKFEGLGYFFNHGSRNHELLDRNEKALAEVDVLLENGEYVMAVEVKTHLMTEDVQGHVKRMNILRRVADEHNDRRRYLGAVAGAVVDKRVLEYALKKGFYVIIPSGETVDIEAPEGFKPRIW